MTLSTKRHLRPVSKGASVVGCLASLLLAYLPTAQAAVGEYNVEICTAQGNALGRGLEVQEAADRPDRPPINFATELCVPAEGGVPKTISTVGEGLAVGFSEWIINAPEATLISKVEGDRAVRVEGTTQNPQIIWFAAPADPSLHFELTPALRR